MAPPFVYPGSSELCKSLNGKQSRIWPDPCERDLKPRSNGRNVVGCYKLRPFAHHVSPDVRESGFRNPGIFCQWNLESWALESGIQLTKDPLQIKLSYSLERKTIYGKPPQGIDLNVTT